MKTICVYGSASPEINQFYLDTSYELGLIIAQKGYNLVFGGGTFGAMGAVVRGAKSGGAHITAVVPNCLNVSPIIYEGCDEYIQTETLRERKRIMEERADAFITLPGGSGTFEEILEIYAERQLCLHNKAIVIINTAGYFDYLLEQIKTAVNQKFMKPESLELIHIAENPFEAMSYISSYSPAEVSIDDLRFMNGKE